MDSEVWRPESGGFFSGKIRKKSVKTKIPCLWLCFFFPWKSSSFCPLFLFFLEFVLTVVEAFQDGIGLYIVRWWLARCVHLVMVNLSSPGWPFFPQKLTWP